MSVAATETVLQLVRSLAGEMQAGAPPPLARVDDDLQRDLGFDSLERAELLRRLEKKFNVRLPPHTLMTARTPGDLVRALSGASSRLGEALADASGLTEGRAPHPAQEPTVPCSGARKGPAGERRSSGEGNAIRIGDVLFAGYAWVLLLTLGLAALVVVLTLPRLPWRRRVVYAIARAFVAASGVPVRVSGTEHIPSQGQITVVANHASYLDALVLTKVLPAHCNFVAKSELAQNLAIRLLLGRIGTHFVARVDAQASVLAAEEIAALAKLRESFVFFAEGTFTGEPGLRPFRMGAFVTAASAGTPVLPVAIRGTRAVLREGQWFPRRGPIELTVSASIIPDGCDWAAAVRLRDRTRAAILGGCGEHDVAGERS